MNHRVVQGVSGGMACRDSRQLWAITAGGQHTAVGSWIITADDLHTWHPASAPFPADFDITADGKDPGDRPAAPMTPAELARRR